MSDKIKVDPSVIKPALRPLHSLDVMKARVELEFPVIRKGEYLPGFAKCPSEDSPWWVRELFDRWDELSHLGEDGVIVAKRDVYLQDLKGS